MLARGVLALSHLRNHTYKTLGLRQTESLA